MNPRIRVGIVTVCLITIPSALKINQLKRLQVQVPKVDLMGTVALKATT
jgi:hypothetical protein